MPLFLYNKNKMADSYKIKVIKESQDKYDYVNKNNLIRNTACFSMFNNNLINIIKNNNLEEATIIIEKNKVEHHSKEFIDKYLKYILKTGIIPYTIEETEDEYLLHLDINEIKNKAHLQYTGMIIRCLYEPDASDSFQIIAKHFVNLCDYFPNRSKSRLFMIACNIFINEYFELYPKSNYWFNSNHILMYKNGCKILGKTKVKQLLNTDTGINSNFTDMNCNLKKYKLDDETKESYSKML